MTKLQTTHYGLNMGLVSKFLLVLLIFVANPANSATDAKPDAVKILVLGDSLSAAYGIPQEASWLNHLANDLSALGAPTKIINASISGETTGGGRARIAGLLERHEPEVLVLELGGNDGLRGFPIKTMRNNLREIILQAQAKGTSVMLLGMRIPPNYGPRYTEDFFLTYQELGEEFSIPVVPFLLEGIALQPNMMQADGIHPTAAAQPLIAKNVLPKLKPLVEDRITGTSALAAE